MPLLPYPLHTACTPLLLYPLHTACTPLHIACLLHNPLHTACMEPLTLCTARISVRIVQCATRVTPHALHNTGQCATRVTPHALHKNHFSLSP